MASEQRTGGGAVRAGDLGLALIDLDRPSMRETIVVNGAGRTALREAAGQLRPANAIERRHLREALALMLGGEPLDLSEGIGWRSVGVRGHRVVSIETPDPSLCGWGCTCPRYEAHSCVHEWVLRLVDELMLEQLRLAMASAPTVA